MNTVPHAPFAVAAVGDVADQRCWSGIPYAFWRGLVKAGWDAVPLRLRMDEFRWPRRWWNAGRVLGGKGRGGYQYSESFLDRAETQIQSAARNRHVITFHQQFPRAVRLGDWDGQLSHYVDATFASLAASGGAGRFPESIRCRALEIEGENYRAATLVVTMARWTRDVLISEYGLDPRRVHTVLPGANFEPPTEGAFETIPGEKARERPLVLGFLGKDWKRKGLPFLLDVRARLEKMGVSAVVRAAGHCPPGLGQSRGFEYVGFINQTAAPRRFASFLASCDVGCLFSSSEPLGISTLEFLRAGVPVAGFAIEGLADTLPPDAGFRFAPNDSAEHVAEVFRATFQSDSAVALKRKAAVEWVKRVTWQRCVAEWQELLLTGAIANPVRPWRGINDLQTNA